MPTTKKLFKPGIKVKMTKTPAKYNSLDLNPDLKRIIAKKDQLTKVYNWIKGDGKNSPKLAELKTDMSYHDLTIWLKLEELKEIYDWAEKKGPVILRFVKSLIDKGVVYQELLVTAKRNGILDIILTEIAKGNGREIYSAIKNGHQKLLLWAKKRDLLDLVLAEITRGFGKDIELALKRTEHELLLRRALKTMVGGPVARMINENVEDLNSKANLLIKNHERMFGK
jgi:hypothetical protein